MLERRDALRARDDGARRDSEGDREAGHGDAPRDSTPEAGRVGIDRERQARPMSLHTGFQVLHGDPHGPTHRDDRLEPDGLAMLRGKYLAKPADRSGHDHREA